MMRSSIALLLVLSALFSAAPIVSADVVVVALDGTGDTTGVQAGFDLAAPGDVVLIREGNYRPFGPFQPDTFLTIDKPLTVIGDGDGASLGFLHIVGIAAGERVIVRNVSIAMPTLAGIFLEAAHIQSCQGAVLLEDVGIFGTMGPDAGNGGDIALIISNCSGVSMTRCTIRGGPGLDFDPPIPFTVIGPGAPAAEITNSNVAFFDCAITGGHAGVHSLVDPGGEPGGPALVLTGSTAYLSGGTTTGGMASDGCDPGDPQSCAGGDGIVQLGSNSVLRTLGATIAGGAGGLLTDGGSGPDGVAIDNPVGIAMQFPDAPRGLSLEPVLREGVTGTITLRGPAGQGARLFLAIDSIYAQLGFKKGVYLLGGPTIGPIVLGVIDGSGQIDVPLSLPAGALAGADGFVISFQGYTVGSEGLVFTNATQTLLAAAGL